MTRRCRPGQRARIIGKNKNAGKVVLIVRYYFGDEVSGFTWPEAIFPWVVASLGGPLRNFHIPSGMEAPRKMVIVVDDCDLLPLDEGEDGLNESRNVDLPLALVGIASRIAPAGQAGM